MQEKKNIVFLYTELAGYSLACFRELIKREVNVYVFHYPVNIEAPFKFLPPSKLNLYDRSLISIHDFHQQIKNIKPDLIVCSGWIDKDYLAICKHYFKKIPTIVAFDNQWKGTLKQRAAIFASSKLLLNKFSHCWVPGERQVTFAQKLGFKYTNILKNLYSADLNFFQNIFIETYEIKKQKFPHRFIYSGRYLDLKGITDLWQAFIELQSETPNDWELWCLGAGNINPIRNHKIKHFGFVQPSDLINYLAKTGVFILPSREEPWGVSVHEFSAAGFPLILSDKVGAEDLFLIEYQNGFIFKSKHIAELKSKMKTIISKSDSELISMGLRSNELSKQITPEVWSQTLLTIFNVRH